MKSLEEMQPYFFSLTIEGKRNKDRIGLMKTRTKKGSSIKVYGKNLTQLPSAVSRSILVLLSKVRAQ